MQERFTFTYKEFVDYQMYIYSKSKSHKKSKMIARIFSIFLIMLGVFICYSERCINTESILGLIFIIIGVVYFFWFSKIIRKASEKYFKDAFGIVGVNGQKNFFIELHEGYMLEKNDKTISEYKMAHEDIFEIDEVKDAFYVRFNTGLGFIVSKKSTDAEKIKEYLKNLADSLHVKYVEELDWVWK